NFVEAFVAQQPIAARQRLAANVLAAHRETQEQALVRELRHHMFQYVPCRRIRPLHVVQQDDEWTRRRGEPQILHDLVEQRVLVARRLDDAAAERRYQARELAPLRAADTSELVNRADDFGPWRVRRLRV